MGTVVYLSYSTECGQSYPADPMIGVRLDTGATRTFWPEELSAAPHAQQSDRAAGSEFARVFARRHGRAPSKQETAVAWGKRYVEAMERGLLAALRPLSPQEQAAAEGIITREAVDALRERIQRSGGIHQDPSYQAFRAGALAAPALASSPR